MKPHHSLAGRIFFACAPPLIASTLQWAFWKDIQPFAWLTFFPAVVISAWLGGLVAGLLSTILSAVLAVTIFILPTHAANSTAPASLASAGIFFLFGVLLSISMHRQSRVHQQLEDANANLASSRERYRMLFESMDEGFCVIEVLYDSEGKSHDYRFIELNKSFEVHSGLKDAKGKTIRQLVPDQDGSWYEIFGEVARTGESIRFSNPSPAIQRHFDVFASRIGGDGSKLIGILFKDITDRQRYEHELVTAKEKAELANLAKDSFLATMSHEIRTPLTGMLGMLELLSLSSLDKEQRVTLDAAWDSGRGLLRIVSDILDWSKIEEGKLEISSRPTAIPPLLQDVVNTYSRIASAKSLKLWKHVDARLNAAYLVDPLRLSQVLNNFVSNAIKFTQHGEIELRADLVERIDSGDRIRFSVRDTGAGIAPALQQQIFQRYRQGSADTARMYGGTGLGLSICRRLAELLDGQIGLQSAPGMGATFCITLTLPVSGAPGEPVHIEHLEVPQREVQPFFVESAGTPRILAVDDHPINRDLLARQIRMLGLRADTAEHGKAALEKWRDGGFDLVITDCHMPEMDGYEFTRQMRRIEAAEGRRRTPVIAWTANALAEEAANCKDAGMDDLLVKPANLGQIRHILAEWLGLDPAASPAPTPPPQEDGPIDHAVLAMVVVDRADHPRILHDFQSHMLDDAKQLAAAFAGNDLARVKDTAHRMKGSCRMVGATAFARACEAIENAASRGDMVQARAKHDNAEKELARLRAYLAAFFPGAISP